MSRILVCGAGGFIGHHLCRRLKALGHSVYGIDCQWPEWSRGICDREYWGDLRDKRVAQEAHHRVEEVYQLAADMGGMGYISSHECDIVTNSAQINLNMIQAAKMFGIKRYFFASSVCVYPDMAFGAEEVSEEGAYPAHPDNEYGWEKLYAERVALTFARHNPTMQVRIARFQNTYGPEGTWIGGREKAPAAICRKVAEAQDGGDITIWGDGTAIRSYTYIDDLVDGILAVMYSDCQLPVNLGSPEYVSVNELVRVVASVAGKRVGIRHIGGPVGVKNRNFSIERARSLGFKPRVFLREGIEKTYPWIAEQVRAAAGRGN